MYSVIKRLIDVVLSSIAIFVIWPIVILIAVLIKTSSKGPIFFTQKRIGKYKKEFHIIKFRTMRMDAPNEMPTHLLQDPDVFITKIGKVLRKTSLDELPQIINVLRGDMSLIGPRPALWNQFDLISERDRYGANDVYPGLTGWAQVNGRDELSISLKAKLDGEYVEKMNFLFDVKILYKTLNLVVNSKGVVEGANAKSIERGK